MLDPTTMEQLAGLFQAIIDIVLAGGIASMAYLAVRYSYWPSDLFDPDGDVPGVLETPSHTGDDTFGGILPGTVGILVGSGIAIGAYFLLATVYIVGVFVSILFFGVSPPNYPALYFIGAAALLIGIATFRPIEEWIRYSRTYRGY